jgi:hypothetical protein
MSNDDPEIIPPERKGLPATQSDRRNLPVQHEPAPRPVGMVGSWLTGFQAEHEARAYRKIAERIRAQTDVLDAQTGLRESTMKLLSKTGELEDFDKTLDIERAERRDNRLARYDKLDYERDERAHQAELTKRRREKELREAERAIEDANRGLFNAKQGLENQQRSAQLNAEIWSKRKETESLDAERVKTILSREIDGLHTPEPTKAGEGTLEQLREMRESLVARAVAMAADGKAIEAEKYERLVSELDELVLEAMRTGRQE